ncbi:protein yellow isoform X2 [Manduca sexta]|uniref:protein yellow isoform X2 n=1 Tax=Manduca sexta TaxID=7130 RepID=UPI00188F5E76|nr:protein yellow isoform X2 [Manduca sexta]
MVASMILFILLFFVQAFCLLPPKFQWKTIDYAWKNRDRETALTSGLYIPQNNMPTGLARWKDKLFITIPRWKKGVPSSLNYIYVNGSQNQTLHPYPNWEEACVSDKACCLASNSCVISAFRVHVDKCNRLWVVDNGVADMAHDVTQIAAPAILMFDLNSDTLMNRYEFSDEVLRDSSVLTSVVVDIVGKNCENSYAYVTDMGSNAILVYHLATNEAWRVENHYFHFDPHAGVYKVGGLDFYWSDGISSAALSHVTNKGQRDLFFNPTSSTKQFRMSTRLLRDKYIHKDEIFNGVEVIGDRGPWSQATACDFDTNSKVLFYTQVDLEGNLWILSNRQSRFLYETMDFNQTNFRVLTAPISALIQGSPCEKMNVLDRALSLIKRSKSNKSITSR